MIEKLNKLFAEQADIYNFNSEEGKNKVIREIEKRFEDRGVIVSSVNGAPIDYSTFENIVFSLSQPFLRVQSRGKYVPSFADLRDEKDKEIHAEETKKVIDFYLDRLGLQFQGEHLEDFSYRSLVKNKIAEHFLFEGMGNEGEVRFRKYDQGMLSSDFDPVDVINHYAQPYLDNNRTREKQNELVQAAENTVLKRRGFTTKSQVSKTLEEDFKNEVNEEFIPKAYSKKRLPPINQDDYRNEFSKRIAFKLGIQKLEAMTLQQRQRVNAYVDDRMENLNSLPEVRNDNPIKFEQPVALPNKNTVGFALPAEML